MNELTLFEYEGKEVRTLERDGAPWFVAKDVCDILELENVTEALRGLDDDEKIVLPRNEFAFLTLSSTEGQTSRGGAQEFNIINEPGLYRLVFQSRKPEAKAFKRWVFHEVLPAIRKTGKYELLEKRFDDFREQPVQMLDEIYKRLGKY
jgi:prophage antirepressor-like protein